jgi:hypothetical protein
MIIHNKVFSMWNVADCNKLCKFFCGRIPELHKRLDLPTNPIKVISFFQLLAGFGWSILKSQISRKVDIMSRSLYFKDNWNQSLNKTFVL